MPVCVCLFLCLPVTYAYLCVCRPVSCLFLCLSVLLSVSLSVHVSDTFTYVCFLSVLIFASLCSCHFSLSFVSLSACLSISPSLCLLLLACQPPFLSNMQADRQIDRQAGRLAVWLVGRLAD